MKKLAVLTVVLLLFSLMVAEKSQAAGLGIAIPIGFGTTDYDLYEADASHFGINFVFDSNVAKRSVFNYRLNVGVEFFDHEYSESYYDNYWDQYIMQSATHKGLRIVTDHTFGFGIVKSSVVRLWLGPTVRIGFIAGDEAGISLGGGLTALGLNFNFGRVVTLALEAGYLFDADLYFDDVAYTYQYYDYGDYYEDSSSTGLNNLFVAKLSILFRIRDIYDDF